MGTMEFFQILQSIVKFRKFVGSTDGRYFLFPRPILVIVQLFQLVSGIGMALENKTGNLRVGKR